ncbi:MAG: sulfotransferase [Parvibaculaceae bacterium]
MPDPSPSPQSSQDLTVEEQFQAALRDQQAGRLAEAEAGYHRVLNRDPRHVHAQHNLGLILVNRGQPGAALALLHYALTLNSGIAEIHNTSGNALRLLGLGGEAEASYRRAIGVRPGYAVAHANLARLLAEQKREEEAIASYRQAIDADPRYREAYINLGNLLRPSRTEDGIELLAKIIAIDPGYDLAHNNMGNFLRDLDRLDEAAESYRRAVAANPLNAVAFLNLGTVLNHLGRRQDSADALRKCIALDPARGEPYFQLADTEKLALDDPAVGAMRRLYDDPRTGDRERMFLAFGLGRVFDQNRLYDDAFACWRVGNRLKRAGLGFDIANEKRIGANVRRTFSAEFLRTAPRSKVSDETPIFIVGMIRSGTTLTEQILASHPQVVGADENTWLPEARRSLSGYTVEELTRAGQAYVDRLRARFGGASRFITDKLVGNWLEIGFIHLALPNARIIRTSRNPYDSCLSAFSSLFVSHHEYCYDMRDVAEFYRIFKETVAHWDEVLPGKVYHQSYEKLIEDPEAAVRKLLDFCDLPFDQRCLDFHQTERRVRTASSQQVREKLHARSLGRWRHYERHLEEWKSLLGDPMNYP